MIANSTRALGIVLGLLLAVSSGCASSSSTPTGSLTGIAVDNNGNPLPGITVSLQSGEGKLVLTVLTGADGSYSFQDVAEGRYTVTTTFAGFTVPRPVDATVIAGATTALPKLVLLPPT